MILIQDNFFDSVDEIRKIALSFDYHFLSKKNPWALWETTNGIKLMGNV